MASDQERLFPARSFDEYAKGAVLSRACQAINEYNTRTDVAYFTTYKFVGSLNNCGPVYVKPSVFTPLMGHGHTPGLFPLPWQRLSANRARLFSWPDQKIGLATMADYFNELDSVFFCHGLLFEGEEVLD